MKFVRIDPRTMMTLRTLNLPTTLDTSRHDLAADFFVPLLTHAQRYDRGVGYFSSGWLRLNAAGMVIYRGYTIGGKLQ